MTSQHDDLLVVGRLGSAYGVQGWLRVQSYTEPAENLLQYTPWHVQQNGRWTQVTLDDSRPHQDGFLVRLREVGSREDAAHWAGALIAVDAAQLPAPDDDEFYWKDLIGLHARHIDGRVLGQVERLIETGASDVLVIAPADDPAGAPLLVPFVGVYVTAVDLKAGTLTIDWPE